MALVYIYYSFSSLTLFQVCMGRPPSPGRRLPSTSRQTERRSRILQDVTSKAICKMQKMAVVLRWHSGRAGMNIVTSNSLHLENNHTRPLLPPPPPPRFLCFLHLLSPLCPSAFVTRQQALPASLRFFSSSFCHSPFFRVHCNLPTLLLVHYTNRTRRPSLASLPIVGAQAEVLCRQKTEKTTRERRVII